MYDCKKRGKNIEKALSWGKGIVYEQIVVDTGSTNRTVEIARQMGAKVFHYQWQGDFSAAKNYAIEQAEGNWIAFLDADEFFTETDAKKILPLLNKIEAMSDREQYHVIKCTLLNIDDKGKGKVFSSMQQARLFHKESAYYKNKIHEQLEPRKKGDFRLLNVEDTLVIYHTGYAPSAYRTTGKLGRNIGLIQDVLRNEPENWDFWSYLGDTFFTGQNFLEAVAAYEKVIRRPALLIWI